MYNKNKRRFKVCKQKKKKNFPLWFTAKPWNYI
jgi:hypothetical protein